MQPWTLHGRLSILRKLHSEHQNQAICLNSCTFCSCRISGYDICFWLCYILYLWELSRQETDVISVSCPLSVHWDFRPSNSLWGLGTAIGSGNAVTFLFWHFHFPAVLNRWGQSLIMVCRDDCLIVSWYTIVTIRLGYYYEFRKKKLCG